MCPEWEKNYSEISRELMIFATGAFCAIVYALSIVLFQYCNSFIMCSQLLLPQVVVIQNKSLVNTIFLLPFLVSSC